jgi:hypothetical protein
LIIAFSQTDDKSIVGIYRWLTFYGHLDTTWGGISTTSFTSAFWGKLKTLFGGELIRQAFYSDNWSFSVYLYLVSISLIWLGIIWMIILAVFRLKTRAEKFNLLLLSLMVVYNLFSFWWAPAYDGFWLYAAVILVMFIFNGIQSKRSLTRVSFIIMALLIIVNFACEFIPRSNKDNSFIYRGAKTFKRLGLTENDLVITNFSQIRLAYEYYNEIRVPTTCLMYLEAGDKNSVINAYHDRIEQIRRSGRVIMFENEIDPEPSRKYLFSRFSPDEYELIYNRYTENIAAIDSLVIHGKNVRLYELLK